MGAFPKLGIPFFGVPIVRTKVFGGLYWGSPIFLETTTCIEQGLLAGAQWGMRDCSSPNIDA